METGGITVKAYLERPGQSQPEIRRFNLEEGASTNFEYLSSKLKSIYPSLPEISFGVYWKDEEGDLIAIGSDDELIQALLYGRHQGLLKLYLRTASNGSGPGFSESANASCPSAEHPGVVCDSCEGPVKGIRFKCMVCPDFDLCGGCCDKGLHDQHHMLRMTQPATDWSGKPCGGPGRGGNRPGWWWPGHPGAFRHGGAGWNPRRFWKQFMKSQWQNGGGQAEGGRPSTNQSQGCAASAGGCSGASSGTSAQQQSDAAGATDPSQAQQREFLEHVGQQVSAILEPFGILVDVEERKNPGYQSQQAGGRRGKCAQKGRCNPDPKCKKDCSKTAAGASGDAEQMKTEPSVSGSEGQASTGGAEASAGGAEASAEAPHKQRDDTDMDSDESSWIKVEPKPADMDVIVLEPLQTLPDETPSAPPQPDVRSDTTTTSVPLTKLYPSLSADPSVRPKSSASGSSDGTPTPQQPRHQPITDLDEKVFQAVNQMKAMGFHDEGGWMTEMLYLNDGEIYRVIDNVLKTANNKKN